MYNSWDPNWRGFIGTTFVVALEEFGHLVPANVTALMEESLFDSTKGTLIALVVLMTIIYILLTAIL